jgi:hypothetical protein
MVRSRSTQQGIVDEEGNDTDDEGTVMLKVPSRGRRSHPHSRMKGPTARGKGNRIETVSGGGEEGQPFPSRSPNTIDAPNDAHDQPPLPSQSQATVFSRLQLPPRNSPSSQRSHKRTDIEVPLTSMFKKLKTDTASHRRSLSLPPLSDPSNLPAPAKNPYPTYGCSAYAAGPSNATGSIRSSPDANTGAAYEYPGHSSTGHARFEQPYWDFSAIVEGTGGSKAGEADEASGWEGIEYQSMDIVAEPSSSASLSPSGTELPMWQCSDSVHIHISPVSGLLSAAASSAVHVSISKFAVAGSGTRVRTKPPATAGIHISSIHYRATHVHGWRCSNAETYENVE